MAKGNTGNLLQHFVGLTAARRLAAVAAKSFEYVDPFAMAPWEPLERADASFVRLLESLETRSSDFVAQAFVTAFHDRYPNGPPRTNGIEYPNTTALLLHAGLAPDRVTACEMVGKKRHALAALLTKAGVEHETHVDSRTAQLSACRGPALVMLDPYQVQAPRRKCAHRSDATHRRVGQVLMGREDVGGPRGDAGSAPRWDRECVRERYFPGRSAPTSGASPVPAHGTSSSSMSSTTIVLP